MTMNTHVVLATRFGAESEAPAAEARRIATLLGGGLTVMYVAAEVSAVAAAGGEAGIDPAAERAQQLELLNRDLREFVAAHFAGIETAVRVVEGDVADTIAETAAELHAAYLVVGTHGRSGLARLVLGDTTTAILQRTPCPVIVVPLRDTHGEG